jgi:hypothetical protein
MKRLSLSLILFVMLAVGSTAKNADAFGWGCGYWGYGYGGYSCYDYCGYGGYYSYCGYGWGGYGYCGYGWGGCWTPSVYYYGSPCVVSTIIIEKQAAPTEKDPDVTSVPNKAYRAWLYGDRPKLVIGELQGMKDGAIEVKSRKGDMVMIDLPQLSSEDQIHVVQKLCGDARPWTDESRKFSRTAKFSRVEGKTVVLTSNEGRELTIPLTRLCEADQIVVTCLAQLPDSDSAPDTAHLVGR